MWRAVQVWGGLQTPVGAPFVAHARALHWHALLAWDRALLEAGVPTFESVAADGAIAVDRSAPSCADAVQIIRQGRAHPLAAEAWRRAGRDDLGGPVLPRALGGLDASRVAYTWAGADVERFGRALVDRALALSLASLTAWDEVLHRSARALGRPLPPIRESGARYEPEPWPREEFLDSIELRARRVFDCEDGSTDRAAELRAKGCWARAEFIRRAVPSPLGVGHEDVTLYHIVTNSTVCGLEDVNRDLGMGTKHGAD